MKTYDTIVIFNDEITDAGYHSVINECKETLKELGCTLIKIKTDVLGKKKLAYPIKAYDRHEATEGWYVVFTYEAKPITVSKFEEQLRINSTVMKLISTEIENDATESYEDDNPSTAESEQDHPEVQDAFDLVFDI